MSMTVNELIEKLLAVREDGGGEARVAIEEVGQGYFGDLDRVDTHMGGHDPTLTLLGTAQDDMPLGEAAGSALATIRAHMARTTENFGDDPAPTEGDYLADIVMELVRSGEVRMDPREYQEHYDHATDGRI